MPTGTYDVFTVSNAGWVAPTADLSAINLSVINGSRLTSSFNVFVSGNLTVDSTSHLNAANLTRP
jgi:hypothetical protein